MEETAAPSSETKVSGIYPFSPERKSDIRDLWIFYRDGKKVLEYIHERLVYVDLESVEEEIAPTTCESFQALDDCFRQHLYWTSLASDALAVTLAVTISVRMKGPLLWIYLIGPSGCGKSTICEAISADKIHIKRVNSFTGLHSGYKTADGKDVSLINKLHGKGLIVPDFTSILALSPQMQEKIYGELRNIYDGISAAHWGNDTEHTYTRITFPIVAGVTHEIHGLRKSALGERFLKVDMTDPSQWDLIIHRTIANVAKSASDSLADNSSFDAVDELNPFMRELKAATLGFLQYLFRKIAGGVHIHLPQWFAKKIAALAVLVAAARGQTSRQPNTDRDLIYRPMLEVGSHVGGQLAKLAIALAVVLDREPDEQVLRLVQKVALDTAYGFSLDIIRALGSSRRGLTHEQLASKIRLPSSTVRKLCADLRELGVVCTRTEESASGIQGRDAHVLYLSRRLQSCWDQIFPEENPSGSGRILSSPSKSVYKALETLPSKKRLLPRPPQMKAS